MSLSFDNLRKYPFQYFLFLCISVIGYLYFHDQIMTNETIKTVTKERNECKALVKDKDNQIKVLDSLLRNCMWENEITRIIDSLSKK